MFKKSFAEMLKENLNEDSFKPPPPPPPQKKSTDVTEDDKELFSDDTLDPFLLEVKKFYLTVKDVSKIYSSRNFHKKMFKEPVKLVFYWAEEDWQGSLFVVYTYKNKYIYINGGFGSCELCDGFPQNEESLIRKFRSLNVCDSVEKIELSNYAHPELIKHLTKFKTKSLKLKKKTVDKLDKPENSETTKIIQEVQQNNSVKSWASLFK